MRVFAFWSSFSLLLFPEEQKTSIQLICTAGSTALNNLWYVMLIGYQALLAFLMALIAILAHYVLHKNFQKPNALIILDYFVAVDYGLGLPAIIVSGFSSSISVDVVFSLWCLVGTVLLLLCFVFLFLPPLYNHNVNVVSFNHCLHNTKGCSHSTTHQHSPWRPLIQFIHACHNAPYIHCKKRSVKTNQSVVNAVSVSPCCMSHYVLYVGIKAQ